MQIKRMPITALKMAEYNPRVMLKEGDPEFERLRRSIDTFGNVEPIVWNMRTGNVVGGHQRLAVLAAMGETETDVSVVDLTESDEKLLNVALNKIQNQFDYDAVIDILKDFSPEDVKLSGFSAAEVSVLLADVNAAVEEVFTQDLSTASNNANGASESSNSYHYEHAENTDNSRYDSDEEYYNAAGDDDYDDYYDMPTQSNADEKCASGECDTQAADNDADYNNSYCGASYVIILKLASAAKAAVWLSDHQIDKAINVHHSSAVIDMSAFE